MDRADLIAALEKAEGPSRELDAAIFALLNGREPRRSTFEQYEPSEDVPAYTASLDAALSLVPKGWEYSVHYQIRHMPPGYVYLNNGREPFIGKRRNPELIEISEMANSPALALCIAALRAMD